MKNFISAAIILIVIFTLDVEGASYYDVVCDDVIISYVAYEPSYSIEWKICNELAD